MPPKAAETASAESLPNIGLNVKENEKSLILKALEECRKLFLEEPETYAKMRETAHERTLKYTMQNSTKAQFEYFRELKREAYGL